MKPYKIISILLLLLVLIFAIKENNGVPNFFSVSPAAAQLVATKHMNVTVNGTPINLSWSFQADLLVVQNIDATNAAAISFDGGTLWFNLLATKTYEFPASTIRSIYVKRADGTASNATLNCIVFLKR